MRVVQVRIGCSADRYIGEFSITQINKCDAQKCQVHYRLFIADTVHKAADNYTQQQYKKYRSAAATAKTQRVYKEQVETRCADDSVLPDAVLDKYQHYQAHQEGDNGSSDVN